MPYQFSKDIDKNIAYFNKILSVERNFDLVYRVLEIGGRKACVYFVDGFTQSQILERLLTHFQTLKKENMPEDMHGFSKQCVPYGSVGLIKDEDDLVVKLLSGICCMFIDDYDICLSFECREYPNRGINEPEKDKVLRGSHDGFNELLLQNVSLIRRRIRDPKLIMEVVQVGVRSRTDIAICYMDDKVDKVLLQKMQDRIKSIEVNALTMNQESLAECLYDRKWYNPFPKYKFSERPDTVAAHLLEGNIVIMTDNSPSSIILPSTIFDILEQADDYNFSPITGTYLRWARFSIAVLTLLLTPTWLLAVQNPEIVPDFLLFTAMQGTVNVPVFIQLLILEFAIDGLKLASQNTPNILTMPLSVISGIVLGEYAVKSGWFNSETMLYMSFVAVGNYTQSSYELGYALKFMRLVMLLLVWLFNFWGYIAGILLSLAAIAFNRTMSGKSYIYPLIPFNWKKLKAHLFRLRIRHEIKPPQEKKQ